MHELSIIQNVFQIIENVAEENRLTHISHVKLQVGKLQQIVPDMLTFAFETVAQGTKADGASLEVAEVPITMKCNHCGDEFLVEEHIYICPACSETDLTMLRGMEIILESVEGELEES